MLNQRKMSAADHAVRVSQIKHLYRELPVVLVGDVVAAVVLFVILASVTEGNLAAIWLAMVLGLCAVRGVIVWRFQRRWRDSDGLDVWHSLLLTGAFLSGLLWGFAWLPVAGSGDFLHLGVTLLWISGTLAGAAMTLSVLRHVFVVYALTASLPPFVFLLIRDGAAYQVLVSALVLYVAFTLVVSSRTSEGFRRSFALEYENGELMERLRQESNYLARQQRELDNRLKTELFLRDSQAQLTQRLQVESQRMQSILDSVEEGIFAIDENGLISTANASARRLLDLEEGALEGRPVFDFLPETPRNAREAEPAAAIAECLEHGVSSQSIETGFPRADGKSFPVRLSCRPIWNKSRGRIEGAVVSFMDVSRQKEMGLQLVQAQKMEAIGRLAGGIAHDFNNLLTVVTVNAQLLELSRVPAAEPDRQPARLVEKILDASRRGGELTRRLLDFSRNHRFETRPEDVNQVVSEMHDMLRRSLGERIEFDVETCPFPCIATTDRNQLENALLNLCINARDAMPEGGRLVISVIPRTLDAAYNSGIGEQVESGDYIEVAVTDSGIGMSRELQMRIFEPFFTTKPKGQGTGLGLSSVYAFMQQTGGHVHVYSEEGTGTTFKLYLPETTEQPRPQQALLDAQVTIEPARYTVLIVEDDVNVRDAARGVLDKLGFHTLHARDGESGLRMVQAHPRVDLVFSDVIMTGPMTGVDLALAVRELRPGLPVLLATGYADTALVGREHLKHEFPCVSKPYDSRTLLAHINALLAEKAAG